MEMTNFWMWLAVTSAGLVVGWCVGWTVVSMWGDPGVRAMVRGVGRLIKGTRTPAPNTGTPDNYYPSISNPRDPMLDLTPIKAQRGLDLYMKGDMVAELGGRAGVRRFEVKSDTNPGTVYFTNLPTDDTTIHMCTCLDHALTSRACKHMVACHLYLIERGEVDSEVAAVGSSIVARLNMPPRASST